MEQIQQLKEYVNDIKLEYNKIIQEQNNFASINQFLKLNLQKQQDLDKQIQEIKFYKKTIRKEIETQFYELSFKFLKLLYDNVDKHFNDNQSLIEKIVEVYRIFYFNSNQQNELINLFKQLKNQNIINNCKLQIDQTIDSLSQSYHSIIEFLQLNLYNIFHFVRCQSFDRICPKKLQIEYDKEQQNLQQIQQRSQDFLTNQQEYFNNIKRFNIPNEHSMYCEVILQDLNHLLTIIKKKYFLKKINENLKQTQIFREYLQKNQNIQTQINNYSFYYKRYNQHLRQKNQTQNSYFQQKKSQDSKQQSLGPLLIIKKKKEQLKVLNPNKLCISDQNDQNKPQDQLKQQQKNNFISFVYQQKKGIHLRQMNVNKSIKLSSSQNFQTDITVTNLKFNLKNTRDQNNLILKQNELYARAVNKRSFKKQEYPFQPQIPYLKMIKKDQFKAISYKQS